MRCTEIFSTPQVQSDEKRWKEALTKTVVFLVLAPFDSEVRSTVTLTARSDGSVPCCHCSVPAHTACGLCRCCLTVAAWCSSRQLRSRFSLTNEPLLVLLPPCQIPNSQVSDMLHRVKAEKK